MRRTLVLMLVVTIAALMLSGWRWRDVGDLSTWQRQTMPGALSLAHAELQNDCAACHTSVVGADDAKCIGCHANNTALLQRQATAFHATIGSCGRCHIEHQGESANLQQMDHTTLARIGLKRIEASAGEHESLVQADLVHWVQQHPMTQSPNRSHPELDPFEMTLNCRSCHATAEPHAGLFGPECTNCHVTSQWTIAQFQHPGPGSFDCAQCHQAPPSHYMEHFAMISKTVAGQTDAEVAQCCGPAQVNQCYRCHQTTSWNDIKGVGWYKHH